MRKHADVGGTAEGYLQLPTRRGAHDPLSHAVAARAVDSPSANAGPDSAPLIEAYARRGALGLASPRPLTIPHEVVAVAMAHGYAMVTGRGQAVMVHVIVGTANALGGIMNAARS